MIMLIFWDSVRETMRWGIASWWAGGRLRVSVPLRLPVSMSVTAPA